MYSLGARLDPGSKLTMRWRQETVQMATTEGGLSTQLSLNHTLSSLQVPAALHISASWRQSNLPLQGFRRLTCQLTPNVLDLASTNSNRQALPSSANATQPRRLKPRLACPASKLTRVDKSAAATFAADSPRSDKTAPRSGAMAGAARLAVNLPSLVSKFRNLGPARGEISKFQLVGWSESQIRATEC